MKNGPSDDLGKLAKALELQQQRKKPAGNPNGPPPMYRFKPRPEWRGNEAGRPRRAIYVEDLVDGLRRSSPPKELCLDLGIDPKASWGHAIVFSLGKAALAGDVSAAREVLAALGFSGTAARNNVLVNVETPGQRGVAFEFLRHAHGLSEDQLSQLWAHMDSLPRAKPVVDASYFPDESYSENKDQKKLEANHETTNRE